MPDSADVVAAIEDSFVGSVRVVSLAAAGFILLGFGAAIRLPHRTDAEDPPGGASA